MLTALFADQYGEIFDAPGYGAAGRLGEQSCVLSLDDMIPMPEGATLAYLPARKAVGTYEGQIVTLPDDGLAVAVLLPAGYTRTHVPDFRKDKQAPLLPLYGYAAAALYQDEIYVAAIKSDENEKWNPVIYNTPDLKKKVTRVKKALSGNRIVEQLAHCSLTWHCCTAQNLFYHRWEAGIPVSPACNADCLGCISLQPAECCPSPQSRISFRPDPKEIAQLAIYHLQDAPEAIVSFGQGCEGEPSLEYRAIAQGIGLIRAATANGIININTNAGFTEGIQAIVDAGLDSMRVSIISAREETYQAYYRCRYTLADVKASIAYAKAHGVRVSLNMLSFPGLNDRQEEVEAWLEFLQETQVDMIQLRNLNMDPDYFLAQMPACASPMLGVKAFVETIRQRFPAIQLGSFSHYVPRQA